MAMKLIVVGESGSGKSRSIQNLNPKETFIIGVTRRSLPFKGWKSKYKKFVTSTGKGNHINGMSNYKHILTMMEFVSKKLPHVKNLIIDDQKY